MPIVEFAPMLAPDEDKPGFCLQFAKSILWSKQAKYPVYYKYRSFIINLVIHTGSQSFNKISTNGSQSVYLEIIRSNSKLLAPE